MPNDQTAGIRYPWDTPPEHGQAIEVADGVLWTRLPLPMALDHVNVYALRDDDGWTVIDTGFASKKSKAIWQDFIDGPLGGGPVNKVIVTHHHPDHIGLAGWFQTDHGSELITTRTAWLFGRMLTLDVQEKTTPETLAYWKTAGMDPEILAKRAEERPFNFGDIVAPLPVGYTRVKQGDVLAIIDPQSFENRVRQLSSRLEAANADTRVRQASINRAEVNLSQAETVLRRQEDLFSQNIAWIDKFPVLIIELHDWMLKKRNASGNFLRAISERDRDFYHYTDYVVSISNTYSIA